MTAPGVAINRCRAVGIVPVAAYRSLRLRVPDTPIRAMLVSDHKLERSIYLSHRPDFLNAAEDYAILDLLDQHIASEMDATASFLQSDFQFNP